MSEQSIFLGALDIADPAERSAYLDQACGGNPSVRQHIEELIAAQEQLGDFLDKPHMALDVTDDLSPVTERPGMQIGPYKLLEQIGEGGFGVVFMAEQQQPVRRKVALKVLKPGMDTRQVVARFEAERQALALMDHPNIARVLDAGETTSGRPYFVMELVKGIPITQFCDEGKLSTRERLELFVTVCQAAQHAHQKGIIHRDLKPTNVLVTLHDGTPVAKVIDFGVAKATGQQLTEKTLFTGFAQMVGTPLYMSPEQAALSGLDIDTRTDIYSLGVLLYELLTGTTPLQNERLRQAAFDEVRRLIREEEPIKPSTRISTLGATAVSISAQRRTEPNKLSQLLRNELDWIVMKALEKDRGRRYETASAFAADISRYLRDEQVEACPPSTIYRLRKFARRNRVVFTSAALVAAALLIGLAVSISLAIVASRQRDRAELATLGETEQRKAADAARQAEAAERATAERERDEAQKQRDKATALNEELNRQKEQQRRTLYATHMALVQKAWESGKPARIRDLLNAVRPKPGEKDLRGIEWYYWQRMIPQVTRTIQLPVVLSGTNEMRQAAQTFTRGETAVAARFSHDGKVLAVMKRSKRPMTDAFVWNVQVWNTDSGKLVFSKELPTTVVVEPAVSSQRPTEVDGHISYVDAGRIAVTTYLQKRDLVLNRWDLRIYEYASGKEVVAMESAHPIFAHLDPFVFSRDGSRFAAPLVEPVVKVWDSQTGREVAQVTAPSPPEGTAETDVMPVLLALSPDGTMLAMKRGVSFSDQEGKPIPNLKPLGITLAETGSDKSLTTASVNAQRIEFSPDGKRIAAFQRPNSADPISSKAIVFDVADGRQVCTVAIPRELTALRPDRWNWFGFTGDGKHLVATFKDDGSFPLLRDGASASMRFWDAEIGKEGLQLEFRANELMVAGFAADGRLMTCDRTGAVKSWRLHPEPMDLQSEVAQARPRSNSSRDANGNRILSAASPDGGWWFKGPSDRPSAPEGAAVPTELVLEDVSGVVPPRTFSVPGPLLEPPQFSPTGKFVFAVVLDSTAPQRTAQLKVWEVASSTLRLSQPIPTGLRQIPTQPRQAVGRAGFMLPSRPTRIDRPFPVVFSPDGQTLVAPVGLWPPEGLAAFDLSSGQRRWTIDGRVVRYRFCQDGGRLFGVRHIGVRSYVEIAVWDADTGEEVGKLMRRPWTPAENNGPTSMASNPDGSELAAIFNGDVIVADVATGREWLRFPTAAGTDDMVHYSADGGRLIIKPQRATTTIPQTQAVSPERPSPFQRTTSNLIRICDAATGQELLSVPAVSPLYAAVWAQSGDSILPIEPDEEATWLLDWLASSTDDGRLLTRAEIIERIKSDRSLRDATRESALKTTARLHRSAGLLAESARAIVRQSDQPRASYSRALEWSRESLEQDPDFGDALFAQGAAYYRLGQYAEAVVALAAAHRSRVADDEANSGWSTASAETLSENLAFLAMAHHKLGHVDEAQKLLYQAEQAARTPLQLTFLRTGDPTFRGTANRRSARSERLIEAAELIGVAKAVEQNIKAESLWDNGDLDGALSAFGDAIRLDPRNPVTYLERAGVWHRKGQIAAALKDLDEAHRLDPSAAEVLDYRAWIRATCADAGFRDGNLAIEDAQRACELTNYGDAVYLSTLAAAYAESGNFEEAVKVQQRGVVWSGPIRSTYQDRLKFYQEGKPYHELPIDERSAGQ